MSEEEDMNLEKELDDIAIAAAEKYLKFIEEEKDFKEKFEYIMSKKSDDLKPVVRVLMKIFFINGYQIGFIDGCRTPKTIKLLNRIYEEQRRKIEKELKMIS